MQGYITAKYAKWISTHTISTLSWNWYEVRFDTVHGDIVQSDFKQDVG